MSYAEGEERDLNPLSVLACLMRCSWQSKETGWPYKLDWKGRTYTEVQATRHTYLLDDLALSFDKELIESWLRQLPETDSGLLEFSQLSLTSAGQPWTHSDAMTDALIALGIGIGCLSIQHPGKVRIVGRGGSMIRCKDCLHYLEPEDRSDWRTWPYPEDGYGQCHQARSENGEPMAGKPWAWAQDSESHQAWLNVKPDFGCLMGKRKTE